MTEPNATTTPPAPAPPAPAPERANKAKAPTLTRLVLAVVRDATTTMAADVLHYELPVIQAIYGEDFVTVQEQEDVELPKFDVNEAFAALKRKYEKFPGAVAAVYRNLGEFAREAGVKPEGLDGRREEKSMQKVRKAGGKK